MAWSGLSEWLQYAILLSSGLTAVVALFFAARKVYHKISSGVVSLAWLFTEEHDHEAIKSSLKEITDQLTNNGGTSLKDAIDRIEHKADMMSARMRTHLHTNDKALFETDRNGHINYVNRAYERLTGLPAADADHMGWVNIIDDSDRERIVELWFKAVNGRRNFDECLTVKLSDGTKSKAHAMAYVIRGDDGNMLGHIGELALTDD